MKDYDETIPDATVSLDFWQAMHNREQSAIIDTFYGQYKSKVSCLECGSSSVKYDPFASLSLDIPPLKHDFVVRVMRIPGRDIKTDRSLITLSVDAGATVSDIYRQLSMVLEIDSELSNIYALNIGNGVFDLENMIPDDQLICKLDNCVVLYVLFFFNASSHEIPRNGEYLIQVYMTVKASDKCFGVGIPFILAVEGNKFSERQFVDEIQRRVSLYAFAF